MKSFDKRPVGPPATPSRRGFGGYSSARPPVAGHDIIGHPTERITPTAVATADARAGVRARTTAAPFGVGEELSGVEVVARVPKTPFATSADITRGEPKGRPMRRSAPESPVVTGTARQALCWDSASTASSVIPVDPGFVRQPAGGRSTLILGGQHHENSRNSCSSHRMPPGGRSSLQLS
eukprot:TRINITY_DN217_c0_g1_i1.p2 TRINITY_DN217_c0_g1~~TRINITY_DN217_c0_g1_i1.p2  ORF type:complete len:180 (-),score=20.90 TRINITY_DN217_c0_g1_i1:216-755(-)